MPSLSQAILSSWTVDPALFLAVLIAAAIYARGWLDLHRQMPERFTPWRLASFFAGLGTLVVAAASPLDAFAGLLLQVHMLQHLLLMTIAPPLILLGAPPVPLLRGLPTAIVKNALGPFIGWGALRRMAEFLSHPVVCWMCMALATWLWHLPAPYQLALRSPVWHGVEHACFLAAGLLFWWPVVQPWPSVPRWPRWAMIPYLLLADIQNTALAALLTFSDRVLYPIYASVPRLNGIAPLDDQAAAGVLMWVPMSIVYLLPAAVITARLLSPESSRSRDAEARPGGTPRQMRPTMLETPLLASPRGNVDLLKLPFLGAVLRWRHLRPTAQAAMFLLAFAMIVDGLLGPQMSPMNLAGVLPWTHWRGLTVIALLAVGNLFCMACPFMLPRAVGRRLGLARWSWPRALRSKWPAVALLLAFFWAYEVLGLWDSPRWTAALVLTLFAGALTVDTFFRGASFCKYVCPIGQFHFVQSLVSPFEVAVRRPQACADCTTNDCIRGNAAQRGCELELFLPRKAGNLDCTFCLDCVRACPHDNIGVVAAPPGRHLLHDHDRSSLGRLSHRADVAALIALLVFAAYATAAPMTATIAAWLGRLGERLGATAASIISTTWLASTLIVVPVITLAIAAMSGRALSRIDAPLKQIVCRFALALVPLGAAMWAAHFMVHLGAGWRAALPAVQRAAADAGIAGLGTPQWSLACPGAAADALVRVDLLLLDVGLLLSLYAAWRIARACAGRARAAFGLFTPWAVIGVALYLGGVWILLQPMQMRGLMGP